jgi:hypothetical protein
LSRPLACRSSGVATEAETWASTAPGNCTIAITALVYVHATEGQQHDAAYIDVLGKAVGDALAEGSGPQPAHAIPLRTKAP